MIDIVDRLRAERDEAKRSLWLIVHSNGGYKLEREYAEDYPGDDVAWMETVIDGRGDISFRAFVAGPILSSSAVSDKEKA